MTEQKDKQISTVGCGYRTQGYHVEQDGITFSVVVPSQKPVSLLLYKKGTEEVAAELPFLENSYQGVIYTMKVSGINPEDWEYNFRIDDEVVQDLAARLVTGRKQFGDTRQRGAHQIRCGFIKEGFHWGEMAEPLSIPYEDLIIYQLHVRGFTKHKNSKVRAKGTFRGLQEKLPYLKMLGINQILLMPAYEFNEIVSPDCVGRSMAAMERPENQKLNFWGYVPGSYYAPKQSYAVSDQPDLEFKEMVQAFHETGIEVAMEFYFPDNVDAAMAADCLSWWVQEYHVDGFHLLMNQDAANMLARNPRLMKTKLMADYFPADYIYGQGEAPLHRVLAEFNDGFKVDARRLLKGDEDQLGHFVMRMRKNPKQSGVINYITGHDGFTLMDLVSYDTKHNEDNGEQGRDGAVYNYSWNCGIEGPTRKRNITALRMQQMKNAFAMLLLAQGTPLILAGDEFGNSQKGNNNPYCHDNELTWVDWNREKPNQELTEFVKKLISYRKCHRILHMSEELTGSDLYSCGYPDFSCHSSRAWYGAFEHTNRHVGLMYCGTYAKEDNFIYVAYNLYWDTRSMALPQLPEGMEWHFVMDTTELDTKTADGIHAAALAKTEETAQAGQKYFEMPARSVRILEARMNPAAMKKTSKGKAGKRKIQKNLETLSTVTVDVEAINSSGDKETEALANVEAVNTESANTPGGKETEVVEKIEG